MSKAILKNKEVVIIDNVLEWAAWLGGADLSVEETEFEDGRVSTVFLGLSYSDESEGLLWFETMIFGGINNYYQARYETWAQAKAGHKRIVELNSKGDIRE